MWNRVLFLAAVYLAAISGAAAQAQPSNGLAFQDFNQSQLVFIPPSNATTVAGAIGNPTDGLKTANSAQVIFSLPPCSFFTTHIHPNRTEIMTGVQGLLDLLVFLNGRLLNQQLKELTTVAIPQGVVHFYFNPICTQTIVSAILNSATPGTFFYYDPPASLLGGNPTAQDVQKLIATQTSNGTADPMRLFTPLQNGCQARCGLPPAAGASAAALGRRLLHAAH